MIRIRYRLLISHTNAVVCALTEGSHSGLVPVRKKNIRKYVPAPEPARCVSIMHNRHTARQGRECLQNTKRSMYSGMQLLTTLGKEAK